MALLNNENAMKSAATTAFSVDYSCRFESASSTYLSKTLGSSGNQSKWTFSCWFKRAALGAGQGIFFVDAGTSNSNYGGIWINASDQLEFIARQPTWRRTNRLFRDTGAWMHLTVVYESGASTGDEVKFFINGVRETSFAASSTPSGDYAINGNFEHRLGIIGSGYKFSGYQADVHFIDGTAKTASDFAETDSNGQWVPKEYTGSYGDNGFRMDFADSSDLGADAAGSNDFTTSNLGSEDQVIDTPSAGKNFCTLNALGGATKGAHGTLSEGNLRNTHSSSSVGHGMGTIGVTSGKWYFEATNRDTTWTYFGVTPDYFHDPSPVNVFSPDCEFLYSDGNVDYRYEIYAAGVNDGMWGSSETAVSNGDVIGVAFDADNGKIWYSVNGAWSGSSGAFDSSSPDSTISGYSAGAKTWFPCIAAWTSSADANFGQDATFSGYKSPSTTYTDSGGTGEFFYEPPSGFKALCTENLPAVTLNNAKSSEQAFEVITYEGTETEHTIPHSGTSPTSMSFNPDLIWIKNRSNTTGYHHGIADTVRGISDSSTPILSSSSDGAEYDTTAQIEGVSSNQITLGDNSDFANYVNLDDDDYVAWVWKAHQSGTNEKYNAAAGFSIVTYTGDGETSGDTQDISHSLGEAPEFMLVKNLDDNPETDVMSLVNWAVYHKDIGSGGYLMLDSANASTSDTTAWGDTAPTGSVFTVGYNDSSGTMNLNHGASGGGGGGGGGWGGGGTAGDYIAYLFRSIEGYSKVGSYTGNGDDNGPFVHLGFRPAFILIKNADASGNGWLMFDSTRSPHNAVGEYLITNSSAHESDFDRIDFVSNGFKLRKNYTGDNSSSTDYIFYAVAENPFKHANAR